jgi:hypothetical protein
LSWQVIAASLGALTTMAGPATDAVPAPLPRGAVVPLVAVLWQEPEERFRQASVEAVVYEEGTVVLDVSTDRPEWGRLSAADLARLRDDVRQLAADWQKDQTVVYGAARLGADTHFVFLRVEGGEFRHLSVGGHPLHSGIWRADPSSLPAALVRVLAVTHDAKLLDRHPLLPSAFGVWFSPGHDRTRLDCKWPNRWPAPTAKTRLWPAVAGFVALDGQQWRRFREIARACEGSVSWRGDWVHLDPEARVPGEEAWASFRAAEIEPPKLATDPPATP